MRFSVALIMTFVLLPIATSFSHAEDIERITVTGKRQHWPDHNVRNFYIHHASRRGLKRTPTSLDFEQFNDDKARACFKGHMKIKSDVKNCVNTAEISADAGILACTTGGVVLGVATVAKFGMLGPILSGFLGGFCGLKYKYDGLKLKARCELAGDTAKFHFNKQNNCQ